MPTTRGKGPRRGTVIWTGSWNRNAFIIHAVGDDEDEVVIMRMEVEPQRGNGA